MRSLLYLLCLSCASLLGVSPASAQVADQLGFFGEIDGRWMWMGGDLSQTTLRTTNGPGGQFLVGYKFATNWDIALAGDVQGLLTELTQFRGGTLTIDTSRQHIDLEAGYSQDWWRLNFGLRGARFLQRSNYVVPAFTGYDQRDLTAVGPKVGVGARVALGDSDWAILTGADLALLYAMISDSGTGVLLNGGSYSAAVPQGSLEATLGWRAPASKFSVAVGARVAASFNTAIVPDGAYRGTWVEFGPLMRMAYNFGPAAGKRAAAAAPEAAQSAPAGIALHFDFEDSTISPVANSLIRQAAEDARRGHPVVLRITEATDRSDGVRDGRYTPMRVAAVRERLMQFGLSPDQVFDAPREDDDRVTPTAAGMDDPRNRTVHISY